MSWNKHRSESFGCLNGVKQGGVLSPILFTVYIDELLLKLRSSGFACYIDDTFVGALGYADDVTLMSSSIRGLKQMVDICETFAAEYDIKFNEKKTVAILFGNGESSECHLKLNGQPVTWVREVKHFGKYCDIRFNRLKGLCEKTVNFYRLCKSIIRIMWKDPEYCSL